MNALLNERGVGKFKVFLWFLFLGLVSYVALMIVPVYIDYAKMKDEMKVKAGVAQVLKDEEILRDLTTKAKELDLPAEAVDYLALKRDDERRRMKISTRWDVEVRLFGNAYVKKFHFEPMVEESYFSVIQ